MKVRGVKTLTLVEILVSVTIFSLLSLSLYLLLNTGILVKEKIEVKQNTFQNVYLGLEKIAQEIRNAVFFRKDDSGFKGDSESLEFYTLLFDWEKEQPKILKVKYNVEDEYIPEEYVTKKVILKTVYEPFEEVKENQEKSSITVLGNANDIGFSYFYIEDAKVVEKESCNLDKDEERESSEEEKKIFPQGVKIKLTYMENKESEFSVEKYVFLYNDGFPQ